MAIRTLRLVGLLILSLGAGFVPMQAAGPVRAATAHTYLSAAPTLDYLRLVGGGKGEQDARVALGGSGNMVLAGITSSPNWPVPWTRPCTISTNGGCAQAFLLKLAPDGTHVYYRIVLGGSRLEHVTGLTLDAAGNAYLTGTTTSPDFPTVHPLQPHCSGRAGACSDGFVAKVDPRGRILYSTFLGGSADDQPNAIAVDRWGNAYVAGSTTSRDFPVVHAMQPRLRGRWDGFVTRISPSGNRLLYSTYLGGSGEDGISAIAVDRSGQAYVTGNTVSRNFPTSPRSLQPHFVGGNCTFFACMDVFVTRLDAAGRFLAGTFLATPANDNAFAIGVDGRGNAYVAGSTGSSRIPSTIATVTSGKNFCGEEGDIIPCQSAFVIELTDRLDHLVYSRMLRGDGLDRVDALAVDVNGSVVAGGYTESTDFPTVNPTQAATGGGECSEGKGGSAPCDGFLAAISPRGTAVTFSTYVGGNGQDSVDSVAIAGGGTIVFAGTTWSSNIPPATGTTPLTAPTILLGRISHAY